MMQADAERPYTILSLGDSTTLARTQIVVYTDQLAGKFPKLQFLNKGIGGNTTKDAVVRLTADVLAHKPDLVIVQFGINDASIGLWKNPPENTPAVLLADYEKNLRHMIREIRGLGAEMILMTPNQLRWTEGLKKLYGKPPHDPESEMGLTNILASYAQVVRDLGAEYSIPLVDVYALYDEWSASQKKSASELLSDGMHPNQDGHTLVADALAPFIAEKRA